MASVLNYYLDFETTSQVNYEVEKQVRVWLWHMYTPDEVWLSGTNIKSFIDQIVVINKTSSVWVYNLKFEGSFIEDYLLYNGYKQVLERRKLRKKEFRVIKKNGMWYSLQIGRVTFKDFGNFITGGIDKVAEKFCPNLPKLTVPKDYHKRYIPLDYKPTDFDIDYNKRDVEILYMSVPVFFNKLDELITNLVHKDLHIQRKLTIAGVAYKTFQASVPNFKKLFPKTSRWEYNYMIDAYTGGYVFARTIDKVTPEISKKNVKDNYYINIYGQDIKSCYPYAYIGDVPIGTPIQFFNSDIEKANYPFKVYHVKLKFQLKSNYVPIIGGSNLSYVKASYKASSDGEFKEYKVSNIDFERWKKYYHLEYEILGGIAYHGISKVFKNYADYWFDVKEKSKELNDEIMGTIAKMMLNSPYGKTAMNGQRVDILKYLLNGEINQTTVYKLDDSAYEYLPLATFVTAKARAVLFDGAEQIGWNKVVYADTDSLKSIVPLPKLGHNLGDFELEYLSPYFKILAPKRYLSTKNIDQRYQVIVRASGFGMKIIEREFNHNQLVSYDVLMNSLQHFRQGITIHLEQFKKVRSGRVALSTTKDFK